MEVKKITVFGENYISAPMTNGCDGCKFNYNEVGCNAATNTISCSREGIIWTEDHSVQYVGQDRTFTENQIVSALKSLGFKQSFIDSVIQKLENMADPEYPKYLELKDKFKGL